MVSPCGMPSHIDTRKHEAVCEFKNCKAKGLTQYCTAWYCEKHKDGICVNCGKEYDRSDAASSFTKCNDCMEKIWEKKRKIYFGAMK